MPSQRSDFIAAPDGAKLAYRKRDGNGPTVIFCGGFMSDMTGSKAVALETHCAARNQAYVRFDYRGHGESEGEFSDGTIGDWLSDALTVIDRVAEGTVIIVGSSMGGWIALLAALSRPARIAGLLGIAAAPDFTEKLLWSGYSEDVRNEIMTNGRYLQPSDYGEEPYIITRHLITEGRRHLILDKPIGLAIPIRLIHGQKDCDVPWDYSLKIAEQVESDDVEVTLIKSGDHRLSDAHDLERMTRTLDSLIEQIAW